MRGAHDTAFRSAEISHRPGHRRPLPGRPARLTTGTARTGGTAPGRRLSAQQRMASGPGGPPGGARHASHVHGSLTRREVPAGAQRRIQAPLGERRRNLVRPRHRERPGGRWLAGARHLAQGRHGLRGRGLARFRLRIRLRQRRAHAGADIRRSPDGAARPAGFHRRRGLFTGRAPALRREPLSRQHPGGQPAIRHGDRPV